MNADPNGLPPPDLAVEFLAKESHVPIADVTRLYGSELVRLGVGAKVTAFLPILALRKVREALRERTHGKLTPV